MEDKKQGITVLDLFCGAGGFSEGFHQAGFNVVVGIDNWEPACQTFKINSLGESLKIDLLKCDIEKIVELKKSLNEKYGEIDIIVGSPPCTEFSIAKNGGKGNIEKGMLLVRRYLLFIAIFKPKFWVMENTIRLESVLNKECSGSKEKGWTISYEKIGIPKNRFEELGLEGESLIIPRAGFFLASDFGTHQNRKRFIAGKFPIERMEEQKINGSDTSLGMLIEQLEQAIKNSPDGYIIDPNYPYHKVKYDKIRDYFYDASLHPLYWESIRHFKRRHIQYGQMKLPEELSAPSRTVLAVNFPVSREALLFKTDEAIMYHGKLRKIFRQPKVREIACIQGFPLDFQLAANPIDDRYRLVGNAVPCQLSFAIAKSIYLEIKQHLDSFEDSMFLKRVNASFQIQKGNNNNPVISEPKQIVNEATGIHKTNRHFAARPDKKIRRKVLSSRLKGNSCEVIFQNNLYENGHSVRGQSWGVCLQKCKGNPYYRVYLDERSIGQILDATNRLPDLSSYKKLAKSLLIELEKGIPILQSDWSEFPGWSKNPDRYLSFITENRAKIPSISQFQKLLTQDLPEIGELASPIDFFDGLDAIMLRVFSLDEFKALGKCMLLVSYISDSITASPEKTVLREISDLNIPMVTVMSCLLSINVLNKMYENTTPISRYQASVKAAKELIDFWLGS
jgi:site-specific DNA-cytosine methylase